MNEPIFYLGLIVFFYLMLTIIDFRRMARFLKIRMTERWAIAEFNKAETSKNFIKEK